MTADKEPEVKDIERVEVEPAEDDIEENDEGAEVADQDSSSDEADGAPAGEERQPREQIVRRQTQVTVDKKDTENDLAEVPGETARERALRLEVKRLRGEGAAKRTEEIMGSGRETETRVQRDDPKRDEILKKYKPEQLEAMKEVIGALAPELGFVRAEEVQATNWQRDMNNEFQSFIEEHPEYLPENDADNALWGAFQREYRSGAYNTRPESPKALRNILNKVHKEVFGIQTRNDGTGKIEAQKERARAASHSGASGPSRTVSDRPRAAAKANTSGLRADMLKGFSAEELADMGL